MDITVEYLDTSVAIAKLCYKYDGYFDQYKPLYVYVAFTLQQNYGRLVARRVYAMKYMI